MSLSADELAHQAGSSPETVRRFVGLGLIAPDEAGGFRPADISKVRLAVALDDSGVALDDLGRVVRGGGLTLDFAERMIPHPVALVDMTYRELPDRVGLPVSLLESTLVTLGIPPARWDERVREDEAELCRLIVRGIQLGISEKTMARVVRIYGENLRRVVEFEGELWRSDLEAPLLGAGVSALQMLDVTSTAAPALQQSGEEAIVLLRRRYLEGVVVQNVMGHLEGALEEAGVHRRRAATQPAIAFLDISGYTRLTEISGDEAAAEHAARLAELVQVSALGHGGRPVKLLGDGCMFHFAESAGAVRCGLELVRLAAEAGLPPARVGVNAGPLIARDGDYFGRTVNVAARVADYARPREVLVTDAVVGAATETDLAFEEIGPVSLRGVGDPVPLFLATRRGAP